MREMEILPPGCDVSHDQSFLQTEVALLQGFWRVVLCLLLVLIPLVSCPWQREQLSDTGKNIG